MGRRELKLYVRPRRTRRTKRLGQYEILLIGLVAFPFLVVYDWMYGLNRWAEARVPLHVLQTFDQRLYPRLLETFLEAFDESVRGSLAEAIKYGSAKSAKRTPT